MDHYGASLELKTVDIPQRIISGFAAAHSNQDRVQDIIDPSASVKSVARLGAPSDVGVFVGHETGALEIGLPQTIKATDHGLYTETYILQGADGDNLLAVAKDLHDHGHALGMSIGYRTRESKPERVGTKTIRRILDYDLKEYSFASRHVIANPKALVTGVKARRKALSSGSDSAGGYLADASSEDDDIYHVETRAGRYHVVEADGTSLCDFATQVEANAALAALHADATEDQGEEGDPANDDDPINKTTHAVKAVWSTAFVNNLPDSSFLLISDGGQKDDEGKTVPRSLRHLPYRGADGALDLPHLRDAIGRIPQMKGVDDATKARLQARARKLLADAGSGKTITEEDDWKSGAPLAIRGLAYRLLDLSDMAAEEIKALGLLGEDTKGDYRLRAPLRAELDHIATEAKRIAEWGATIDKGQDEAARIAWHRHRLALAAV